MAESKPWVRQQLLVAFDLYFRLRFGQFDHRNSTVIYFANLIGRTPSALAMKLSNLASLDPVITASGRSGLTGASTADRAMWLEMKTDWLAFSEQMNAAVSTLGEPLQEVTPDVREEPLVSYQGMTKEVITKVRIGQSYFRSAVLSAYNNRCCISGLAMPKLLIASHIVPWSEDPQNRLNPTNGLALSALHDKAFDLGLLTIDESYRVVVSSKIDHTNDYFFDSSIKSFHGKSIFLPDKFSPQAEFLAMHRETIFEKGFKLRAFD